MAELLKNTLIASLLTMALYCPKHSNANNFSAETAQYIANTIATQHYLHPPIESVYKQSQNPIALNHYLKTLDKYSRYLSPAHIAFVNKRNQQKRIGIGVDLLIDNNNILAVPLANSPLSQAGMTTPAYIHSINDTIINYHDLSSYQFLNELRSGQVVTVKTRDSQKIYKVRATRIKNTTLQYKKIHQYGVITLRTFTEKNVRLLKKALLKTSQVSTIIIDLRHTPGGDLYATTDALSFLLKKNQDIAYLKRGDQIINLQSLHGQIISKKKIIILLSRFTASSAEIFTIALKHYYPNLTLVGEKTAGKCLAQEDFPLKNNALLHLSVYTLLTPTSLPCQNIPILPDHMIKNIELMGIKQIIKRLNIDFHINNFPSATLRDLAP